MKSTLIVAASLLLAPFTAFAVNTYNVYSDGSGTIQLYQPGGDVKITGAYSFEVGVFAPGTNFSNFAQVAANFTSFGSSVLWDPEFLGPDMGAATQSFAFDEVSNLYPVGITVGNQLSMWVYDSKSLVPSSDWIVITNSSWLVRPLAVGAAVDSVDYTITDPGTTVLLGSVDGDKFILTPAIPEPSTYAALFGVAALGFVASRRRRA